MFAYFLEAARQQQRERLESDMAMRYATISDAMDRLQELQTKWRKRYNQTFSSHVASEDDEYSSVLKGSLDTIEEFLSDIEGMDQSLRFDL